MVATGGDAAAPASDTPVRDEGCTCQLPGAPGRRGAWTLLLGASIMVVFGRRRRGVDRLTP
jgi:hypothetical protein